MIGEADDVYVGEETLLEVHRSSHLVVARSFGEDWESAPFIQIKASSLAPADEIPDNPLESRPLQATPRYNAGFVICVLLLAAFTAFAILNFR